MTTASSASRAPALRHAIRVLTAGLLSTALAGPLLAQDGNEQQLLQLASAGETQAALELISRNTDVNQSQSDGTTALHWAIYYNDPALVARLVDSGVAP
jgi:ankyrin repeat protein